MPYHDWNGEGEFVKTNCYLFEYDTKGDVIQRPLSKDDPKGPIADESVGPHVSQVLADDAIKFIDEYNEDQPFYMYLAIPCPHDPRQSPEEYRNMYPADKVQLPPSHMLQHPFDNGHMVLRDEELAPWPRTEEVAKQHLGDYYGIITHLDYQLGRVIDKLKESGMYENTIIIMAGDSGLAVGNHGLMGKQNIYDEDGIHIPLIFSGGALDDSHRGSRKSAFCYNYDVMPTICEMVGAEIPQSVTGKSLVPVIEGKRDAVRDNTYHAYLQFQRAYRKGEYKLIEYVRAGGYENTQGDYVAGSRVTQLFNIEKDPWETLNLSIFSEYKEIVDQMRVEMRQKAMEIGDYADGKRTKFDFWSYYE
ncbi:MAG: sulfatase-like hydrolase/transferase [Rikenellaceae bacterium]